MNSISGSEANPVAHSPPNRDMATPATRMGSSSSSTLAASRQFSISSRRMRWKEVIGKAPPPCVKVRGEEARKEGPAFAPGPSPLED